MAVTETWQLGTPGPEVARRGSECPGDAEAWHGAGCQGLSGRAVGRLAPAGAHVGIELGWRHQSWKGTG